MEVLSSKRVDERSQKVRLFFQRVLGGPIGAAPGPPLVRWLPGWTYGGPSGGVAPEAPAVPGRRPPRGRILPPQKEAGGQPVQA